MIGNNKKSSLQKGTVIIIMLLLILIISTMTLSFFYLQILEIDLIAYETDYLHAFYFAQAALAQGENMLAEVKNNKKVIQYNTKTNVDFELGDQWNINLKNKYYEIEPNDSVNPGNPKRFYVIGSATVDNVTRTLAKDFEWTSSLPQLQEATYLALTALYKCLENPPVVLNTIEPNGIPLNLAYIQANQNGVKALGVAKSPPIAGVSKYMDSISKKCFDDFRITTIIDLINNTMNIKSLYNYQILNQTYLQYQTMPSQFTINSLTFTYIEKRRTEVIKGIRETLINADFTIKPGKEYILKKGLYFFQNLTLGKGSILKTDGEVVIYCSQCVVQEKAQMIGGNFNASTDKLPQNLVLMIAQPTYNPTINQTITLGIDAAIYGQVIIPNGTMVMSGRSATNTLPNITGLAFCNAFNVSNQTNNPYKINFDNTLPGSGTLVVVSGSWREE